MKNIKIGLRLLISFILVAILSASTGVIGVILLSSTNESYTQAMVVHGFAQGDIGTLTTELANTRVAARDLALQTDPAVLQATSNTLETSVANVEALLVKLEPLCVTEGGKAALKNVAAAWAPFKVALYKMRDLGIANKPEEAIKVMNEEGGPLSKAVITAASELSSLKINTGNQVAADLQKQADTAITVILIIIGLALAVSVGLGIYISKSISGPLQVIKEATGQMYEGNLDISVPVEGSDEVAEMSKSFNGSVGLINACIKDLTRALSSISRGDFDVVPGVEYRGDFKQLEAAMDRIVTSLSETMGQINQSADQVSSGSDQVSSGAQALSQGATEQASSIQELSATIGDISSQVKKNAENAENASVLVSGVSEQLVASNSQMQEMIEAMGRISDSSNEIGKIIKTIEDIAFQTNILALNAAVEAARAGAAGKGFAVVADEVRNLATKSSAAAKDTTALIESSIVAVGAGTKMANGTAQSLLEVVESTQGVVKTVEQISSASKEQASAISQVNLGVEQISSVVQTNSATAEESAAASEELSSQSQVLKGLVSNFKLSAAVAAKFASGGGAPAVSRKTSYKPAPPKPMSHISSPSKEVHHTPGPIAPPPASIHLDVAPARERPMTIDLGDKY